MFLGLAFDFTRMVLINVADVTGNPSFTKSCSFPLNDGIGISNRRVPIIPNCLPSPLPGTSGSTSPFTANYYAVLIGDVDGNWKTANSNQQRVENEDLWQ